MRIRYGIVFISNIMATAAILDSEKKYIGLLECVAFVVLLESGICVRQCCGKNRGFIMHIANNFSMVWLFS